MKISRKIFPIALLLSLSIYAHAQSKPQYQDEKYNLSYSLAHPRGEEVIASEIPVVIRHSVKPGGFCKVFVAGEQMPCEVSRVSAEKFSYGSGHPDIFVFDIEVASFSRILTLLKHTVCVTDQEVCNILNANIRGLMGMKTLKFVAYGHGINGTFFRIDRASSSRGQNDKQLHLKNRNDISLHIGMEYLGKKDL